MANIRKKIINTWDRGITTSNRDNNPDTSLGAQMVKGFDVYKNPNKLIPMQSWTDFTTVEERAYNIQAMGGLADTVYGVGTGLSNWLGSAWQYRIKVDINPYYNRSPLFYYFKLSSLPQDFWDNAESDLSDVRITTSDGVTPVPLFIENVDGQNGDMYIDNSFGSNTVTETAVATQAGSGNNLSLQAGIYAYNFPFTYTGDINTITASLRYFGTPQNLVVSIYTDSAGTPGTLVQELGEVNTDMASGSYTDVTIPFETLSLNGNYHIVFSGTSNSNTNYWDVQYSASGSITVKRATDAGITSWTNVDTSATPNYTLGYYTYTGNEPYFYIYYGGTDVGSRPYSSSGGTGFLNDSRSVFSIFKWFYTFGDSKSNNRSYSNNGTGSAEAFETDPTFIDGHFLGTAISTGSGDISTDSDDDVGFSSNDISVSFMIKLTGTPSGGTVVYRNLTGGWSVSVNNARKILFDIDGSIGNTTVTSTLALNVGKWYIVDCVFDNDHHIYINGIKETFYTNDGDYDGTDINDGVFVETFSGLVTMAMLIGYSNDFTDDHIFTKTANFIRQDEFFTVNTEEAKTDTQLSYSGVQVYKKSVTSGDWSEYLIQGLPVKDVSYYATNTFIDESNSYFMVSSSPDYGGNLSLAKIDATLGLDPIHLDLFTFSQSNKFTPRSDVAMGDNTTYFGYGFGVIGEVGDPGSSSAFALPSQAIDLSTWRDYLAICYSRRNRATVNIWDLANSQATDRFDVGQGNARIVGNASDILFCVVDNFTDDAVKSADKPTIEVRQYIGNGSSRATHVLEVPAVVTNYDDFWERAVSNMKIRRNTQTLFYMRIPKDSTATTFHEGLWAIGKGSEGTLSLTLQIDTEGLGMPQNIYGFAQQVFFIQKDGNIKRLAEDTYDGVALFTTLKMNEGNTEIEKKLHGIEVVTEPLEAGQTVSVYFKTNGQTTRTKICDMTGEGEISREATYDIDGLNLPHYQEIEFDVESVGGKSAVLEFNYKYEYLSDIT